MVKNRPAPESPCSAAKVEMKVVGAAVARDMTNMPADALREDFSKKFQMENFFFFSPSS